MEAKDTLKTGNELCLTVCQEYRALNLEGKDCTGLDCDVCQLNKQAEISFKAGEKQGYDKGVKDRLREIDALIKRLETKKQEGIREVVEWAKEECPHLLPRYTNRELKRDCPKCWQAKLKEWGI